MITVEKLKAIGVSPAQAELFAAPLNAACQLSGIPEGKAEAAFVGQLAVESRMFTRMEENLYYVTPARIVAVFGSRCKPYLERLTRNPVALANFVYANRGGNGDEASGDGYNYRGSGLIQLTLKNNYLRFDITDPSRLRTDIAYACEIAARYFASSGCIQKAERGNFESVTLAINGPALMDNAKRTALTLAYLGGSDV